MLSLEEAKSWLRLVTSREDTFIKSLCIVAQDRIEDYTGLALSEQTFEVGLYDWPDFNLIRNRVNGNSFPAHQQPRAPRTFILPRCPLASVESIQYLDSTGDRVGIDDIMYSAVVDSKPGVVSFHPDFDAPELVDSAAGERIFITFKAKIPVEDSSTIEVAKVAARYAVSHWFNNRSPVVIGASVNELPGTSQDLLRSLRIDRPFYN